MGYKWRVTGLYPVDADTAGTELTRIYYDTGALEPRSVVEESRPEEAPLHPCFEWRDEVAAQKYREHQAGGIIRNIVVTKETADGDEVDTRAIVHIASGYHPLDVVIGDKDKLSDLLQSAYRDLLAFRQKYNVLEKLAPVFTAIDGLEVG